MKSYKNIILAALSVMLIACLAVHFVHIQGHTLTTKRWRDADASDRQMLLGSLLQEYAYPGASKQALEDIIGSPYMEMTQQQRDAYFPGTEDAAQIYRILINGSTGESDNVLVSISLAVFYRDDVIVGAYVFTTDEKIYLEN